MPYSIYPISPLEHMMATNAPGLFTDFGYSIWVLNGKIDKQSFMKRWGYLQDRYLGANVKVLSVAMFPMNDGTEHTIFLTDTDACKKETGGTFSYITDSKDYLASVASISTTTVTFKASTIADTEDMAAGDRFILNEDHMPTFEPNTSWAKIKSVSKSGGYITGITLEEAYIGTSGSFKPEKNFRIRRVYSTPLNGRWQYAVVDNVFCFCNINTPVQAWLGDGFCQRLSDIDIRIPNVHEDVAITEVITAALA